MVRTVMISVIVPVFNAEAYIEQCIHSVLNQSYKDIELIIVNDGSTDGSLEKCLLWQDDERVNIISTENHGVSYARNLGLQNAAGKWIMFLDSDDYLMENCLEALMASVSSDAQQIIGAYTEDASKTVRQFCEVVSAEAVLKTSLDSINHNLLPSFYEIKPLSLASCWSKLYQNSLIRENAIRFRDGLRLSEDLLFNLDYLSCIENSLVTNLPVLYYRQHVSSVTKTFKASHIDDRFLFFDILKERGYKDAAVHIICTLFFEICKIERYTKGAERKQLENRIIGFLLENSEVLQNIRKLSLSKGRWQRLFYKAAAICFRHRGYFAGFALLRIYAAVTKGEINQIKGNASQ